MFSSSDDNACCWASYTELGMGGIVNPCRGRRVELKQLLSQLKLNHHIHFCLPRAHVPPAAPQDNRHPTALCLALWFLGASPCHGFELFPSAAGSQFCSCRSGPPRRGGLVLSAPRGGRRYEITRLRRSRPLLLNERAHGRRR